jgi:tRNA-2-methylthio-N6-dimethylallyladenosine synthase
MILHFYLRTFGCQMNKNDSAIISHLLTRAGMVEAESTDTADIVIVNTCSVRGHAEQRALGYIATLRAWRKKQGVVLAVVGCMAQRCAATLMTDYPFIDLLLGPDAYNTIAHRIHNVIEQHQRLKETAFNHELYSGIYPHPTGISDFVSIMRGCSNYCSYCIVPFVRGPARSRDASDICAQVAYLVKCGVKDITLLGQNVNEYLYEGMDFAGLLEQVAQLPGVCRIRFLTSHPKDLDEKVIKVIAQEPALCEWFHLPMQSGNDRILALMNRQYTKAQYRQCVTRIRETVPGAAITTDIIVGFPTESDQDYQDTIAAVQQLQFDDAYMYRYSSRPGTSAARYKSLPEEVIKRRLKDLIAVQTGITVQKLRGMKGQRFEVLFEEAAKRGGTRGRTRGNRDVVVPADISPGAVHTVEVVDIKGRTPIADIIS